MPHVDLPQAEFKVVLLGDTFTGKTSLVLRFAEGYYRESARSATVGAFFITKRLTVPSVGLTCKIQIWDTAGQEQFKPLAPMYYANSAAAILCFDPANPKSCDTLKYWLDELHRNVPAGRIVIAMAACKCDLLKHNETHPDAVTNLQQMEELAAQMGALFVPTSAKNNENVTQLFSQVAERVLQFQKNNKLTGGMNGSFPATLGNHTSNTTNNNTHSTNTTPPSSSSRLVGLLPRPDSTLHHPHQRAKSTSALPPNHARPVSPHNSVSSGRMSRDDYLHRRSHHYSQDAASNAAPSSPSRHMLTDPNTRNESPITYHNTTQNGTAASPQQASNNHNNTNSSTSSKLNSAMCGDADYLNCAVMPATVAGLANYAATNYTTGGSSSSADGSAAKCIIL